MYLKILFILLVSFLLTACDPDPNAIPTHEEVVQRKLDVTPHRVKQFCYDKGGHYEVWDKGKINEKEFCILPEGYGCDPVDFYQGNCGMMEY